MLRRSSRPSAIPSSKRSAVSGMNWKSPTAPAFEIACGLKPLSIAATHTRSSGKSRSRSLCSNISLYFVARWKRSRNVLRPLVEAANCST